MTHLDDDDMVRYAFGEDTPDAARREHLQACSRCDAELRALTHLVSSGRSLDDVVLASPPDTVWLAIHSELELSPELHPVPTENAASAPGGPVDFGDRGARRGSDRGDHTHAAQRPRVHRRSGRRRAATLLLTAAALVVGLVAGAVVTTLLSRPGDQRLVAEAELEPFPDWQASGSARVEESGSGTRSMVVDVAAPGGGLTEVWLLDPETSGLVSLGLLTGETGTFALPENLDLSRYSVVDVSREPDDGDPAHSGDSIVRGTLRSS